MTNNEKKEIIHKFEELSSAFDFIFDLPNELVLYRPHDEAWSIIEQIVHCVDFEIANFHRYRWSIVSPNKEVLSFDSLWTTMLNYQSTDLRLCLEIIKLIRKFMANHLLSIIDKDWTKFIYVIENKSFNLEEALQHYNNHVDFHINLIERNIEEYKKNK